MRVAVSILCLALSAATAIAQPRPYTPALTCAAVKGIVARQGAVVLATSAHAYELVFVDSGACQGEVTAVPAFEPALDDPNCFAGYRCQQRNNGNTSGK